jgi:SnoaL-like domain
MRVRLRPSRTDLSPETLTGKIGCMRTQELPDPGHVLTELYAAFNRRDVPAVLVALAPDVLWPNGWEGGTVRGRQQVSEYWNRQWAQIDPTVEPVRFNTEDDGRIAVTVHQIVRDKEGRTIVDEIVDHVYRFVDGLVTDMEIRK